MARILRGDVVCADRNPGRGREQSGMRPVVVLSHDIFNERSGTVIAMAVTSQPQRASFPLTMEVKKLRLPKRSWDQSAPYAIGGTARCEAGPGNAGGSRPARRRSE